MIEVRNLTKKYGNHTAIENVSFDIVPGCIYGFLGPNGAGKSTTMNIITGCLAATEGTVTVDGKDIFEHPMEAKSHIGYLPEIPPLYTDMTPYEYLFFVAEAKGVPSSLRYSQVKEVIEVTGLEDHADRLIKNLSKGFRQRVGIAQAMLGDPDVIILDEPTVGLDPKQIIEIRDLIRELGKKKTVILSSHILAEVASVCDRIIIISGGRIVANDTIEAIVKGDESIYEVTFRASAEKKASILNALSTIENAQLTEENVNGLITVNLRTTDSSDLRESISDTVTSREGKLIGLRRLSLTLEDVFLSLTAEALPDAKADTSNDTDEEEEYTPLFNTEKEDE